MEKIIKVECMEDFILTNNDKTKTFAEVQKGEYIAKLYEESQEYFAKDAKGREFLVGEINLDGDLVLQNGFRFSGSDKVVVLRITDELGTHIINSNCFIVKCNKCKKERELVESDIDKDNKISPKECKCGGKNKFHYWLDSIYTEDEYKELERISKLKTQAIELFRK